MLCFGEYAEDSVENRKLALTLSSFCASFTKGMAKFVLYNKVSLYQLFSTFAEAKKIVCYMQVH